MFIKNKTKLITKLIPLGVVILLLFNGCNEKKTKESLQENKSEVSTNNTQNKPTKIEIVANENAKEIKVEEKIKDKNDSKSYYYDYNIKSEYSENAKPANNDASIRAKPRTAIDANINIRSPYEKVQISMIVNKLSKNFIVKCSACHNDYANGVIGPSLLGKKSDFIYDKIMEFKNNKNKNVLMTELVNQMDEKEIRSIANEIYQFNEEIKRIRD